MRVTILFMAGLLCPFLPAPTVRAASIDPLLQAIKAVGAQGEGNGAAGDAWAELVSYDATQLPTILAALDDANPLAANWIRAAVDTIAARQLAEGKQLPTQELETFVDDRGHDPRARRLAYEWLARVDPTAPDRLIPKMLHDPSNELRRDAVARILAAADPLYDAGQKERALPFYRKALVGARDLDQVQHIAGRLSSEGEVVDLARHFGFVMRWRLIGPFDNKGGGGFDVAYPPQRELDFSAHYAGQGREVAWTDHTTTHHFGMVDLNAALGKYKGAAAYAVAEFISDRRRQVQLRLGCITANKVWVNGRMISEHHVYHAGTSMDQYVVTAELEPGVNHLLLKICQNEQTEDWAQKWEFQLRVCDPAGTAILSRDRPRPNAVDPRSAGGR